MMALGFLVAGLVMQADLVRRGAPGDLAWSIVASGAVGGMVGARLLLVLHRWPDFVAAPLDLLTSRGGFIWYGGLLGGVLMTAWPIWRSGVPWTLAADSAAPGLALGYAVGKVGCHLAGDGDWGTPTTLPWGVAYVHGTAAWPHPAGVSVHPAPLYEAVASILIFIALWRLRARPAPSGRLFALYLLATGAARFLIEFVRTNQAVFLGLTEAQWVSVGLGSAALLWLRGLRDASPTREARPRAAIPVRRGEAAPARRPRPTRAS